VALTGDPYGLEPDFERFVVYYAVRSPRFWSLAGHAIEPLSLEIAGAALAVEASRQLAKELGHGPDAPVLVLQRLRRGVYDGKVTQEMVQEVVDLLDYVDDEFDRPPEMESVVAELLPVLKRRMQSQAIILAHGEFAKRGDFTSVRAAFDKADSLGRSEHVGSTTLGPAAFDVLEASRTVNRLPTGVLELDMRLGGGTPRQSLGVWLGDSGAGKSMALIHQAGEGLRGGFFGGFVTLELPEHVQLARLIANVTGLPWNDLLDSAKVKAEGRRRLDLVMDKLGLCELAEFPPHATTVADLTEWVDRMEDKHSRKMELLVVDYADKLHYPRVRSDNSYLEMRYVYEGLRRDLSVARGMWVWTGSQASRPTKDSGKKLDLHHVADSMHKVRVADVVVSLNPRDDGQIEPFVAKNRLGESRYFIGPLPTDFVRARLVPATRELGAW
jgi:hypothetical protein